MNLLSRLEQLNLDENTRLSPSACFSTSAIRRNKDNKIGHRQQFALDADRVLHSRAYTRYIDKTQVFCLVSNDHITHRVLHVQLVSRVARTIGRFLHLNEDLIEAIALGHDIGHAPFGHDGEHFLSSLCIENNLPPFQHNVQSVRFLDNLERKGKGWNLAVQTLDGILCHDGEIHNRRISHSGDYSFSSFDDKLKQKANDKKFNLQPMTLEGCVVRLADTVSYIGRDIEDAILLGLVNRQDLPKECVKLLGDSNGSIVYNLVTDLITQSHVTKPGTPIKNENYIGFSEDISNALNELKKFNYTNIYLNPRIKVDLPLIEICYKNLFNYYLHHLANTNKKSELQVDLMTDMKEGYISQHPPAAMVCDFIAGMTDDFFLKQAQEIGCQVPVKK